MLAVGPGLVRQDRNAARNEMTVRRVVVPGGCVEISGIGYAPEGKLSLNGVSLENGQLKSSVQRLLYSAELANNARLVKSEEGRWAIHGDPTEGALIVTRRARPASPRTTWTSASSASANCHFRPSAK